MESEIKNLNHSLASVLSPAIGILVGQTVLKMLDEIPELTRLNKIEVIQKKLDRIKKRYNKRQFTMIKAKRSCREDVVQ